MEIAEVLAKTRFRIIADLLIATIDTIRES
jgi:hypothetical protein